MPKAFPLELRQDVIPMFLEPESSLAQVAKDLKNRFLMFEAVDHDR